MGASELPAFPAALRSLEDTRRGEKWARRALEAEAAIVAGADRGGRNQALNTAALKLGHKVGAGYLAETEVTSALFAAANRCGLVHEDGPEAVHATIRSGLTAGMQDPEHPQDRPEYRPAHRPEPRAVFIAQPSAPQAEPAPFRFVPVGELQVRPPRFVVENLLEADSLAMLFGDPGCGKSFVACDLALCVATGSDFHGRTVMAGPVFYIAGEGHNGLARRFAAWARHHGRSIAGAPLFKSERAAAFLDAASAQAVTAAVSTLADQWGAPRMIIVDTVARNFGPGDENATPEMSAFVGAMDALRATWADCVVLLVHHSGHAEKQRARGSIVLKAALDTEFRVEKSGPAVTLVNTKMKDAEPPADLRFDLTDVDLGDGASSAVLVASAGQARAPRLSAAQRLGLATYEAAAIAHGIWEDDAFRGVHLDHWRAAFYDQHTGDTSEAKRKSFQRVRGDLVAIGKLSVSDDTYLVRDPAIQLGIVMHRDRRDKAGHCPG